MKPSRIQDLPNIDRPREKLIKYGPEKLSNEELLAILLRTGKKGKNVIQLSKEILKKFGDDILNADVKELSKVEGIGSVKASEIIACFEIGKRFLQNKQSKLVTTPEDIWKLLPEIRNEKKEHFMALFLDARNQELKRELIAIGSVSLSVVHPREVFEPAVRYVASNIILVHNHPSGDLTPSLQDIEVTKNLIKAGEILGIDVIDHIILTKSGYLSFREAGLIDTQRLETRD